MAETRKGVSAKFIKMEKRYRTIFLTAVLLLTGLYFFPLWSIELGAPQFPEGLGFRIWLDKITGFNENDLNSINGLNHYIGMQAIQPDSIPELKYMPYIVGAMIFLGLISFLINKKPVYLSWLILMAIVLIAGLVDFYIWEYNYGHNLNPMAAIKIPGTSFQPPLIGSKQILNMRAVSLPDIGGILVLVSTIMIIYTLIKSRKQKNA